MKEQFERTALLLGEDAITRLRGTTVAVFGVGGVGGFAVEALARGGVGRLVLIDSDSVAESNLNRQIIATRDTLGMKKVDAARARVHSIDPEIEVITKDIFYAEETREEFDFSSYDYVVDAIDSVASKVDLIATATAAGCKIVSSMGAGGKLDPTAFKVADIYKTSVCPLARAVRVRLKKLGIKSLKVVYSEETPIERLPGAPVGSVSFVPSAAGLIIAGEIIKDIAKG